MSEINYFREVLVIVLAAVGVAFLLISSIGIIRLPDVLSRMHAVGKAATLGVSALLLSAGFYFQGGEVWRMAALIALFFITAPISTAAMARAAYRTRLHKRESLQRNDMADPRYETTEDDDESLIVANSE